MQSIQQSLQNFNLAQDRIENTLIRGGAQQQGPWGEFVLKNILDSVGLREGEEYETELFIICSGNFSSGCIELANKHNVKLIDGNDLLKLSNQ